MRRRALVLAILLLTACGGERGGHDSDTSGQPTLAELRGRWVVVNYWAQWCKPCIDEIPELNALHAAGGDVTVLGVNFDGATGESLAAQERALGVGFPTLLSDPAAELGIPRPPVLPTTLIVDPDGRVAATLIGPQTHASLAAAIDTARGATTQQ